MYKNNNKKKSFILIVGIFGLTLLFQIFLYLYFYNSTSNYKDKFDNNFFNIYLIEEFEKSILLKKEIKNILLGEQKNVFDFSYVENNLELIIKDIEILNEKIKFEDLDNLKSDFNKLNVLIKKVSNGELNIQSETFKNDKKKIIDKIFLNYSNVNKKYHEINKKLYLEVVKSNFNNINYMYFTILLNIILFVLTFINWKNIEKESKNNINMIKRYQSILNSAPNGIVIIDSNGKITDINKKAIQLVSWSSDYLIGKDFSLLLIDNQINELIENTKINYNRFFKNSYIKDMNGKEIEIETFVTKNELSREDFIIMVVIKEKK